MPDDSSGSTLPGSSSSSRAARDEPAQLPEKSSSSSEKRDSLRRKRDTDIVPVPSLDRSRSSGQVKSPKTKERRARDRDTAKASSSSVQPSGQASSSEKVSPENGGKSPPTSSLERHRSSVKSPKLPKEGTPTLLSLSSPDKSPDTTSVPGQPSSTISNHPKEKGKTALEEKGSSSNGIQTTAAVETKSPATESLATKSPATKSPATKSSTTETAKSTSGSTPVKIPKTKPENWPTERPITDTQKPNSPSAPVSNGDVTTTAVLKNTPKSPESAAAKADEKSPEPSPMVSTETTTVLQREKKRGTGSPSVSTAAAKPDPFASLKVRRFGPTSKYSADNYTNSDRARELSGAAKPEQSTTAKPEQSVTSKEKELKTGGEVATSSLQSRPVNPEQSAASKAGHESAKLPSRASEEKKTLGKAPALMKTATSGPSLPKSPPTGGEAKPCSPSGGSPIGGPTKHRSPSGSSPRPNGGPAKPRSPSGGSPTGVPAKPCSPTGSSPTRSTSPEKVKVTVVERPTVVSKVTGARSNSGLQPSAPSPPTATRSSVERINVSRLLSIRGFSNTVDIQVNEVKFSCSGAILAYHSPYFEYQLSRGVAIIVLDGLGCPRGQESLAEECLLLLYGAGVVLSDRNITTVLRFSVLYQVENMFRLAMEWARNCVSVSNVYAFWTLGNEPVVLAKRKRKRNDLLHLCKNFLKGREVEVAMHLRDLNRNQGVIIREDFLLLLMQLSGCASVVTDVISCLQTIQ